jgi:hypothetical protein
MLRRFTTLATAVLMLVSVVFFTGRVDPGTGVWLFYLYFSVSFFLLITGVILTERDYFGPRRHPVNRMFVLAQLDWCRGSAGADDRDRGARFGTSVLYVIASVARPHRGDGVDGGGGLRPTVAGPVLLAADTRR